MRPQGLAFRANIWVNLQVLYIMMHSRMAESNSWNTEIQTSAASYKEPPLADCSQTSFLKSSSGLHAKRKSKEFEGSWRSSKETSTDTIKSLWKNLWWRINAKNKQSSVKRRNKAVFTCCWNKVMYINYWIWIEMLKVGMRPNLNSPIISIRSLKQPFVKWPFPL